MAAIRQSAELPSVARFGRVGTGMPTLSRETIGPLLGTTVLPFGLIVYLALKGGGYDTIVRSEIGIIVWWVLILGAVVGALPLRRLPTAAWAGLGVLTAFACWTALGISWSDSAEQSVAEAGRVATYLGVFALALSVQGSDGLRRTVNAVASAIALVAALALLSRLHPSWFPPDAASHFIPSIRGRLDYPLNYWNGVAAFVAIGIPLTLHVATSSRRLLVQGLASAALPAMGLACFYTFSRGGAIEVAVALLVVTALYPRRMELAIRAGAPIVGGVLLVLGATQRDALESGLHNGTAATQGDQMLAMTLVVCAGVGFLAVALGLAIRHGVGPRLVIPRRTARIALGGVAAAVAVAAVVAVASGEVSDRWNQFKDPVPVNPSVDRAAQHFDSASGDGRYQWWQSAIDANSSAPLTGIGPGTFEYWWAQHGTIPGFVRDAHSLYLETLGELGIPGFVVIVLLVGGVLAVGGSGARRGPADSRAAFAAATGAGAAFATAAAVDWVWEIAVLPVVFLLLAAAILGAGGGRTAGGRLPSRLALGLLAVPALIAIAIPMAGYAAVQNSQNEVRASNLGAALDDAQEAERVQPYSASASLQEALVRELTGDLTGAQAAALRATRDEPTNWRTWLILSRIEAERGNAAASASAFAHARTLNPRSPIFAR